MKRRSILMLLVALCLIPFGVHAESKTVTTEDELVSALADTTVTEIVLGADIKTTDKISITRDVTIDGAYHTISYDGLFFATNDGEGVKDNTIWSKKSSKGQAGAIYVLHVYNCDVTIKDITLTNGNRGLLVNGGTATLNGVINVTGNGFQPIEVSSGRDVTATSILKLDDETIILNGSEDLSDETGNIDSTVYIDNYDATKTSKIIKLKDGKETPEEYENGTKLLAEEVNINLLYTIDDAENKEVPADLLGYVKDDAKILSLARVDEKGDLIYTWELDGANIEDPTIVLNTNITFTEVAPEAIKSDLDKLLTNHKNVNFLNFDHEGKLPGLATVSYLVSDKYEVGTKLYIAHYNETTKLLEEAKEVTVDEDGSITFDITECSSYVLYTSIDTPAEEVVENVKTGDINLALIGALVIISIAGLAITSKKIVSKVR